MVERIENSEPVDVACLYLKCLHVKNGPFGPLAGGLNSTKAAIQSFLTRVGEAHTA